MKIRYLIDSLSAQAAQIQEWDEPESEVPVPVMEGLHHLYEYVRQHKKSEGDRSAAEQAGPQAATNEEFYREMAEHEGDWADDDRDVYEIYDESPLSVERDGNIIDVCESTGGPADGYEVQVDEDGDIVGVRYYFMPWGDRAELNIDEDDYPYTMKYLEYIIGGVV